MKRTLISMSMLLWGVLISFAQTYPEQLRDSILSHITGAVLPQKTLSVTAFGAKGDGQRDCLPAVRKALLKASRQGGARIVFPKGTWLMRGPIHLVSNIELHLEEGATIIFDATPGLYLPVVRTSWEGTRMMNYSPFIYGYGLENVSISGQGTINGNAAETFSTWRPRQEQGKQLSRRMNHEEVAESERIFGEGHYLRPPLVQLYGCRGVTLSGVFITNSPFWCIHLLDCENIICDSLRYDAKLVNNDGIDPENSRNLLIQNVSFDNGDDNVAIKSGRDNDGWRLARPSENIIIRNCRFKGLHGVVLGSEMSSGIRNVFVEDCTFAGYNKRGIFGKTNPDRGGYIRNIFVRNCEFGEVEDLLYFTSMYAGEGMDNNHYSKMEDIYVENLRCQKARKAAIVLQGTPAEPIRRVTLKGVTVGEAPTGISQDNCQGLTLEDCHIGPPAGVPSTASHKDNLFK